jgi:hypothetical protein
MKQLIFWDFPRTSWPYNIVVALILAFIFLTPRGFFKDQPRAASVVRLPIEGRSDVFWIAPSLLTAGTEDERIKQAAEVIKKRVAKEVHIVRLEPVLTSEDEDVEGYIASPEP